MCDVILALGELLKGVTVLDLGSGTGVLGPFLYPMAKRIFLTDITDHILSPCQFNLSANCKDHGQVFEKVLVKELDWRGPFPWQQQRSDSGTMSFDPGSSQSRLAWADEEIALLPDVRLLLAADVVYDGFATEAFVDCVTHLMQHIRASSKDAEPVLLVAIEKRFNFAYGDTEQTAHAFDHFRSLIVEEDNILCSEFDMDKGHDLTDPGPGVELSPPALEQPPASLDDIQRASGSKNCSEDQQHHWQKKLKGQPLSIDHLPQSLLYQRTGDLELWVLKLLD